MSKKKRRELSKNSNNFIDIKSKERDVVVEAKTTGQKRYIISIKNNDIVFCSGPAGSGKTAVAVGIGLQGIMSSHPAYEKIVVLRPAKEACGEHIGYLPGDISSKMQPWAAPIIDNMEVFIDKSQIKNLFYEQKIDILPLVYARGRSLNKSFIIVDEAQNLTIQQTLLILTRIGNGSKMIFNGDMSQSDITGKNGLEDAEERLVGISGIDFLRLEDSDIVRNPIIGKIIKRYSSSNSTDAFGKETH